MSPTEKFTERQKAFLAYPRYAIITTINADGGPQSTVTWYEREGDDIIFTTEAESLKAKNMRRDPRISMVITDGGGGRYLSLRGRVEIDENPETGAHRLLKIAKRYYGEEEGTNQFNAFNQNQKANIMMRLKVEKILAVGL